MTTPFAVVPPTATAIHITKALRLASSHSLVAACSLVGLGLALYIFVKIIYSIYFHPLSKHPGPFLARFTDLYAGYHAWKGDIHIDMWRCHQKYGDFVRYAPNRLNVNTATGIKDIYSQNKNFLKSKNYSAMVHQALNTLTVREKKDHGRRRRVISQGLSDAVIRNFEPAMLEIINRFCDRMLQTVEEEAENSSVEKAWNPTRNMSEWCNYLAFDIMTSLIFQGKYNMLERPTYRYVVKVIETSNIRVSSILQAPILKMFRLDKVLFPQAIAARNAFIGFVGKLLRDTKRNDRTARKDLFQILSDAKDPETGLGFNNTEIIAESTTLVVAGADTVATAMTSVFFYLSRNSDSYARAAAEIRSTFDSKDDIKGGAKLSSCRYLRACIDEAMRMSPSVGLALSREVPAGGAVVNGEFIPGGCEVGVPIYSIHHKEDYFADPFKYNPDRWLVEKEASTQQAIDQTSAFVPFSTGPRGCIGKGVALVEMMLTMAVVLYRLDFSTAAGDKSGGSVGAEYGRHRLDEFQLRDHITMSKDGPLLQFRSASS
ncbi:cytochrome P450 [Mytilinidion resinicola]|uniref:Cytochrome P450 n=1 Tax=Mytilinidion resinicola TaxID=574789 RepID=A0A6A6Z1B0_9PEZI|nr:cytochrome P450 [Mytilinidion resinicola]KAF2814017.1 cytochrome P450 [Mytilinidion resinicola]